MDPILRAALLSWDWRADVIFVLLLAGTLYVRGWRRLHPAGKRKSPGRLAAGWRLSAYLGGMVLLALALLSPIDVLSGLYFSLHMLQHVLLSMLVPPLLLLADPLPHLMWGLPHRWRRPVGRLLARDSLLRVLLRLLRPGPAWFLFVAVFLAWHDPRAYEATLRFDVVHDLEHLTFFATGLLFWWPVLAVGPRVRRPLPAGARIAYLLATVPVTMLAGMAFTFAEEPFYPYYASVPRPGGATALQDQVIGGVILWVLGSMMLMLGALILTARLFQRQDQPQRAAGSSRAPQAAIVAAGWET